jgi:hypothetical protein
VHGGAVEPIYWDVKHGWGVEKYLGERGDVTMIIHWLYGKIVSENLEFADGLRVVMHEVVDQSVVSSDVR